MGIMGASTRMEIGIAKSNHGNSLPAEPQRLCSLYVSACSAAPCHACSGVPGLSTSPFQFFAGTAGNVSLSVQNCASDLTRYIRAP